MGFKSAIKYLLNFTSQMSNKSQPQGPLCLQENRSFIFSFGLFSQNFCASELQYLVTNKHPFPL